MVDGHVLGNREAVVGLQAVQLENIAEAGAAHGLGQGGRRVGEEQGLPLGKGELVLQEQGGRAVPPAFDARDIRKLQAQRARVLARQRLAGQDHAGGAVGDLAAVELAQPALDNRIQRIVFTEAALGEAPFARLRLGVAPRVVEVDLGDARQMLVREAVAFLVLGADPIEQERPGKIAVRRFPALPGGGAQVPGAGSTVGAAHKLQADNTGRVVVSGFDVAQGTEHGDGPGSAGGFVARGGNMRQLRKNVAEKAADKALAAKQLGHEVAHMPHFDPRRVQRGIRDPGFHDLAEHGEQVQALAMPVAREVRLRAPQ